MELSTNESWNVGRWVNDRCRSIADESLKYEVLIRLHARAVVISQEVAVLLHGGFSTGALARWRTIHEVWVVFSLLLDGDEDLARRYLNHDAIESMKGQEEHAETWHDLGHEAHDWSPEDRERERTRLSVEFGAAFLRDYGWAAPLFDGNAPRFRQLQDLAQLDHWRSHYRMASHGTHANPKGITWSVQGDTSVAWAGPSNAGLVEPAQCTMIALANITVGLLALAMELMLEAGELADPHRAHVLQEATLILMTSAIDRFAAIDEQQDEEERTIESLIERAADALRKDPLQTVEDLATRLEVEPDQLEEVLTIATTRGRLVAPTRYIALGQREHDQP